MADFGSLMTNTIAAATGTATKESTVLNPKLAPLVGKIHAYLSEAESSRLSWEGQATKNIKAYRGQDTSTFRESEDPTKKVFVRTTTVKTRAAYAQIMESLTANSRFPIMVESTPSPTGIAEYAHVPGQGENAGGVEEEGPESQEDFGIGYEGDGKTLSPGATFDNMEFLKDENGDYEGANLVEGPDRTGQGTFIKPAVRAAEKMNKIMQDQLEESDSATALRKSVFESCLVGSGALKGVMTDEKEIHKWVEGEYTPSKLKFPKITHVSIWDLYIDPNAMIASDAEWMIERHRYTSKQLRDLKSLVGFRKDALERCLDHGANYSAKSFENIVREQNVIFNTGRLWEVLEYWGYLSVKEAKEAGLKLPDEKDDADQVQVCVWVCGNELLRIIVNPFQPKKLPYFVFNYEADPYHALGTGVPETMEDSQAMMNGFARMAIENLALAGNMVFDIDETLLVPGQSMEIYPGKIFRRQGGQPGTAINSVKFQSTAQENMLMFREFRQIADESTGIPSVSHGQTGVTGVGRTSSGLSTILEAASLNIKTVIRNIDDDVLQPLGRMLFYWNNQYNYKNVPKGDLDVIATGTRSYVKQEEKAIKIQTFLQHTANPALAPLVKAASLLREHAKALGLDPDETVNDPADAQIYAEMIGAAAGPTAGGAPQQPPVQPAGVEGGQGEGAGNPLGIGNEGGANAQQQGGPLG